MENTLMAQNNDMLNVIDNIDMAQVGNELQKISQFQLIMQKTLKEGHDFGVIAGTQKPTLLKPGAEKILMLLGLTSEYNIISKIEDYDKGVFAYTIKCTLLKNSFKITEGVGSCNSKEDKYRYRMVDEKNIPNTVDKDTLKFKVDRYGKTRYKIDNDDTCSLANTILKMAKKRAQIDATLTVAALSDIFTQDIEDMKDFAQNEQMENMTLQDAENLKLSFGKHKGQTLKEINQSDHEYITWLAGNEKTDAIIKKACNMILQPAKTTEKAKTFKTNVTTKKSEPKGKENQEDIFKGSVFEGMNK